MLRTSCLLMRCCRPGVSDTFSRTWSKTLSMFTPSCSFAAILLCLEEYVNVQLQFHDYDWYNIIQQKPYHWSYMWLLSYTPYIVHPIYMYLVISLHVYHSLWVGNYHVCCSCNRCILCLSSFLDRIVGQMMSGCSFALWSSIAGRSQYHQM